MGAVLFVGLIMLLVLTLISIASIHMAATNVQIVGNEQFLTETKSAAGYALDKVLNDKDYLETYAPGTDTLMTVDVGQASHAVTVRGGVRCKRVRRIPNSELSTAAEDLPCIQGQGSSTLTIVGGGGGSGSLCANVLWESRAEVAPDKTSGATTSMTQGMETRVPLPDALNSCE